MKIFHLILYYCLIISGSISAQTTNINSLRDLDDYAVLQDMVSQPFDNRGSLLEYEFKLHTSKVGPIEYFIDGNSFFTKSNFDIYNRIIYADFNRNGTILPYKFEKDRIDSLYVHHVSKNFPSEMYVYSLKLDQYAKVIDNGRFILAESFNFKAQKGNINPVLDANSFPDKVILRKTPYLIDSGHWYKIPKQKKELQDFIKLHFRKAIDKRNFKGAKSMDILMSLNKKTKD